MATVDEHNYEGDYFELLEDDELDSILSSIETNEIPGENNKVSCKFCPKICASERGLNRHVKNQHSELLPSSSSSSAAAAAATPSSLAPSSSPSNQLKKNSAEEILPPLVFYKLLKQCFKDLSVNNCYPEHVKKAFNDGLQLFNLDILSRCYEHVKPVIAKYKGDGEKFYPEFCSKFHDGEYLSFLDKRCNVLLGFELCNLVLSYLVHGKIKQNEDMFPSTFDDSSFNEKEKSIIAYLSGYVVGTLYRRIRFSKKNKEFYHYQALSYLMECKLVDGSETDTSHQKFVDIKNRGGLWKVKKDVLGIFIMAERFFLTATKDFVRKIDAGHIVASLLENSYVLSCFNIIRRGSEHEIKKEIALNVLEDMLTLYIRVRAHSYARDKQEAHKISKSLTKSKSLRTEIKKKSSSLDTGH